MCVAHIGELPKAGLPLGPNMASWNIHELLQSIF